MNNKDLFNAINDIDEQFVADAGKYLSDDDSDDPSRSEAIEIFPGESRFSPIKLVASLVAAAVLITGVTVAVRYHRSKASVAPNTSGGNTAVSVGLDGGGTVSAGIIDTHSLDVDASLPFEIRGPDNIQLTYSDITEVSGANKAELSEDNWETITCGGFAYIAAPHGRNFNTIDHTPTDVAINNESASLDLEFKRIYVGDRFGTLTVAEASNTFTRESFSQTSDENKTSNVMALNRNYMKFNGEITANVYLINDGEHYYYIFQNGEAQFPLSSYNVYNFVLYNGCKTIIETCHFDNGISYSGELPSLTLGEKEMASVERYISNATYLKARVTLKNIKMESSQSIGKNTFDFECDTSRVVFNYVESLVTDNNLFGETPFAAEDEKMIRSILGSARTVSDLKDNTDTIKQYGGCDNIKVFLDTNWEGDDFLDEIPDGEINPGNIIALYKGDEFIAAYRYWEGVVTEE